MKPFLILFLMSASCLLLSCTESRQKGSDVIGKDDIFSIRLKNPEGQNVDWKTDSTAKATVLFFLSPECPLCQGYTPLFRTYQTQYHGKGFRFFAIFPGRGYSSDEILKFREAYHPGIPELLDPDYLLSRKLGATITPEVFVLSNSGEVLYSGRIDDWAWETGQRRISAGVHDLERALEELTEGKKISVSKTQAVGCLIEK